MFVIGESTGYENALHAPLDGAVVAFDEIAHDDVHQRVLHQRAEYENGASGHEYVDGLTTQIIPFVILFQFTRFNWATTIWQHRTMQIKPNICICIFADICEDCLPFNGIRDTL